MLAGVPHKREDRAYDTWRSLDTALYGRKGRGWNRSRNPTLVTSGSQNRKVLKQSG